MRVKDIQQFRKWYRDLVPARKIAPVLWNENFMGTQFNDYSGFLQMYHGDKDDVYGFLRQQVANAEDGQAVYEFAQNAADSDSTHFFMFFNDYYFVAINNGVTFSTEGLKSLLNIGQSFGKLDPEKIGRFGIGFKLVHRLVGKTQGLDELLNVDNLGYRGPILFSWYNENQLDEFIHSDKIEASDFNLDLPWLLKILITNFPALPNEEVYDIDFKRCIPFPNSELTECRNYLAECLRGIEDCNLRNGTMIFLKLGEGKNKYLLKQQDEYLSGLETSMHFIRTLKFIQVNNSRISKNGIGINQCEFVIENGSTDFLEVGLTEERDKASDIIYKLIYAGDSETASLIKSKPNIYKFFPAVKEVNNLAFVIHSNVLELTSNRQNLTETTINIALLKLLTRRLITYMEELKKEEFGQYTDLYLSILLSEPPASTSGNGWQTEYFYDPLQKYGKENTPTLDRNFLPADKIIIKDTNLDITPTELGLSYEWFYLTDSPQNKEAIKFAYNKYGIKKWNLAKLIENGDIAVINLWITKNYSSIKEDFLSELESNLPQKNIEKIKFIRCSNGKIYSVEEISRFSNVVCKFTKISNIDDIFQVSGIFYSEINFDEFEKIKRSISRVIKYLDPEKETSFFDSYLKNLKNVDSLTADQKKRLFILVKGFNGITDASLSSWKLFKSTRGAIFPLKKLISPSIPVEYWLADFQLASAEYFTQLDEFLVAKEDIYPEIIHPEWNQIIESNSFTDNSIKDFYISIATRYYDNQRHKGKNLTDQRYIYTGDNFKNYSEVFYHKSLSSITNYDTLTEAIQLITGYPVPHRHCINILSQAPFETRNDVLEGNLQDCEINLSQAVEFLNFCKIVEFSIFNHGVFQSKGDRLKFITGEDKKQYFSGNQELIRLLTKKLQDIFFLLPQQLSSFRNSTGVLRNEDLHDEIVKQMGDEAFEYCEEIISFLTNKEIIRDYINDLPEIRILNVSGISPTSFEYKIILKILENFVDNEIVDIKEKIIIDSNGILFSLRDAINSNKVEFEIESKRYSINVNDILPSSDIFQKAQIVEELAKNLHKAGISQTKLAVFFEIESDSDSDQLKETVYNDLLENLDDNLLENASQIAFCALYEKEFGHESFSELRCTAKDVNPYSIDGLWYVNDFTFLNKTAPLHERYNGLARLLKLNDRNPIFEISANCKFIYKPCFDEEGKFIVPYFDEDLNEAQCVDLLDFLLTEFEESSREKKRDFTDNDWSMFDEVSTEKIIGFNPYQILLTNDDNLILNTEKAPDWLKTWINEELVKMEFIKVLGITNDESIIGLIRKCLAYNTEDIDPEIIASSDELPQHFLQNTFDWLIEGTLWEGVVITDQYRLTLLDAIINKLEWDKDECWEVDKDWLEENAEEWDDPSYISWRERDDSFVIKQIDRAIPMYLSYNDATIAKKNESDHWFDEDDEVFYVTKSKDVLVCLIQASGNGFFATDRINTLLNRGLEKINDYEQRIEQLEAELQQYRQPKEGKQKGDADDETKDAEHRETLQLVREKLELNDDYDCSGWDNSRYPRTVVRGVLYKNIQISLVIRSCIKGTLHLLPREWLLLSRPNTFLVLRVSRQKIEVIPEPLNELSQSKGVFRKVCHTPFLQGKALRPGEAERLFPAKIIFLINLNIFHNVLRNIPTGLFLLVSS